MRKVGIFLLLAFAALLWNGCGGSGNSQGGGNSGAGVPAAIVVEAGDKQDGVAGETLGYPADVKVLDGLGLPVPNVAVTFSASNGGQVFSPSVLTKFNGHALTLMRLPTTPFATMTVTASVGNLKATLKETPGPRLVTTMGNATAARAGVRPDGSLVGIGTDGDQQLDIGYDLFAPDGTVTQRLGPLQGGFGLPCLWGCLWAVLGTPDQSLYFRSVLATGSNSNSVYIVKMDRGLNVTHFIDLDSSREAESALPFLTGSMAADSAGNLYIAESNCNGNPACNNSVLMFDPFGKYLGAIAVGSRMQGIAINGAGHLVALVELLTGPALVEYSLSGQILASPPIPLLSSFAQMVQGPTGDYLIIDEGTAYTFDQSYSLLHTVSYSFPLGPGETLSGVDAAGNFYVSYAPFSTAIFKYDQSGNMLAVMAWPSQFTCSGCPPPASVNALVAPRALASDPVTGDLYFTDSSLTGTWISRYTSGQYAGKLTPANIGSADDVAASVGRNLYVADVRNNEVHVLDMSGNQIGALLSAQVGSPASIEIDSSDNKYVLDISNTAVHVLNASDQTVTTLTLNRPPNYGSTAGGLIRMSADGNLVVCFNDTNTYVVKKLRADGSESFSQSWMRSDFEVGGATGDSKGNIFVAGYKQMKVFDSNGKTLGQFDIKIYDGMDCGMTQQGDTTLVCYANHVYGFTAR